MSKQFTKVKEDFVCEKCGTSVIGSGYTNHCPNCLWSKHVDVYPGDRKSECGGAMEPIALQARGKEIIITHECRKCGHRKNNKTAKNDNNEKCIELSQKHI